jgi:hypothetical protein
MSNQLIFDILPFDPIHAPTTTIKLPLDLDDFAQQLREKWPAGEVRIGKNKEGTSVKLYLPIQRYGPWIVAGLIEIDSYFYVSGWPKQIAKELILWYRHYVPLSYPLFLVVPETENVYELTANTTSDDIEKMYPFPVSDE